MLAFLAYFVGIAISIWAIIKYFLLLEIRIDANTFKTLYDIIKKEKKFLTKEEWINEPLRYPENFVGFIFMKGCPPFYLNQNERLLQAGWKGKDHVCIITCFRFHFKKIKTLLLNKIKENQLETLGVPVEIITPYFTDKIGTLKEKANSPLIENYEDIENEVAEVLSGKKRKTGAILHGLPGNGKTYFLKYLATKYKVPVKIMTFTPEFTNHDIIFMFSFITPKCIVVFEDFDNYFNGRDCIIGTSNNGIKFTFDSILNGLDGIYNTYENVVFFMTANNIDKIDNALKNRPSRFKFVKKFDNPSEEVRKKLLPNDWIKDTENLNLDQILRIKEFCEAGMTLIEAKDKLGIEKSLKEKAYFRFLERNNKNIIGTPEEDWFYVNK